MKHYIHPGDLSLQETEVLLRHAGDIMTSPRDFSDACKGRQLATLFFEPSTRTRLSFESAMLALGGSVLGFAGADVSSSTKGESIMDTVKTVSYYADIIAMRHPKEGAPAAAAGFSRVPVINAGDGGQSHPTQTLADLMTIMRKKGRLCSLTVGFCGDLRFGRTVHSLSEALSRYDGVKFVMISPDELKLPGFVKDRLAENSCEIAETTELESAIGNLDILYMTRVQRERFFNEADYVRLKDTYILDKKKLELAGENLCVMHPLPRVNEISLQVDDDPRACFWDQVECGKFARMALILKLLEI